MWQRQNWKLSLSLHPCALEPLLVGLHQYQLLARAFSLVGGLRGAGSRGKDIVRPRVWAPEPDHLDLCASPTLRRVIRGFLNTYASSFYPISYMGMVPTEQGFLEASVRRSSYLVETMGARPGHQPKLLCPQGNHRTHPPGGGWGEGVSAVRVLPSLASHRTSFIFQRTCSIPVPSHARAGGVSPYDR